MSQLLLLVEATGLSILDVDRLPSATASKIVAYGGIQEGRHRESRFLAGAAVTIHASKLKLDQLLKDAEKMRFPGRLTKDRQIYDQNKERARAAIRAQQGQ